MLWFIYPRFSFYCLCFIVMIINHHTQRQLKIKLEPRMKMNHNIFRRSNSVLCGKITQFHKIPLMYSYTS